MLSFDSFININININYLYYLISSGFVTIFIHKFRYAEDFSGVLGKYVVDFSYVAPCNGYTDVLVYDMDLQDSDGS